ncbi:hypothetical protein [Diaphorobacter aerolatus]|uniref:Uncharacterized protein n=1 Tax=Diaphorobacter aerolatus TaxID=1288495 RepID=A0A7H0GID9_9BURK|nr:hypothetical protein [Diaphorobacter aerolatus]QNP48055.1 hypothetical protein H9K75_18555 [Diaphorobacter aerolatus]
MRQHLFGAALCIALVGITLSTPGHATRKTKESRASATQRTKIKIEKSDSSESQTERDKRLYRECQGLPNAGACAGYTRR